MNFCKIHGKLSRNNENKEDILTSNVFSFFKYADREAFLYAYFQDLGLDITLEEALDTEFIFWPVFQDSTEPDLVILVGEYYLLIEAKYFSGFGQETSDLMHQLMREYVGGKTEADALGRIFRIIAITAHYSFTSEIRREIPEDLRSEILWTNWHHVAFLLEKILQQDPSIRTGTRLFAEDLCTLLVKKGLRKYAGLELLLNLPPLEPHHGPIFIDASTTAYRGDFIGFVSALANLGTIAPLDKPIFYCSGNLYKHDSFFGFLEMFTDKLETHISPIFFGDHND